MTQSASFGSPHATTSERLQSLEAELKALADRVHEQSARFEAVATGAGRAGQTDRLSLIVFSGELDRMIAAFVLATGAAAMGTEVSMFFTFWATAALRKRAASVKKSPIERMLGWMMPMGVNELPLSHMNMGGGGPLMIRHIMRKKGVASVEEMIDVCAELGVQIRVCSMSMDLLGIKPEELLDYPGRGLCGVSTFLETAAPGKLTLFI